MKGIIGLVFILTTLVAAAQTPPPPDAGQTASPPVAGQSTVGVSISVVQRLAYGWSIKRELGQPVYNDQNQKIGKVQDAIISPDKSLGYIIVSTGGFLGMNKHDVAIPVAQLKRDPDGKITLPGGTKDALKAMPEFEYARKEAR